MMPGQYKFEIEERTLARIDRLIARGEEFYKVRSHPGRTREVDGWCEEINGMAATIWGNGSDYFDKLSQASLFPNWYDPRVHGPMQEDEQLRILSDSQAIDAKNALDFYKNRIGKILNVLHAMRNDIDDLGMPTKQIKGGTRDTPLVSLTNTNNPSFINSPQFSQSQTQIVNVWVQELAATIDKRLEDKSLQPHEKDFLIKIKGGLSTVKSFAEAVGLAIQTGMAVGLSAEAVMNLLGVR